MFSFFKKKPPADTTPAVAAAEAAPAAPVPERTWREKLGFAAPPAAQEAPPAPIDELVPAERRTWLAKLHNGLRKTGSSIAQVFTGTHCAIWRRSRQASPPCRSERCDPAYLGGRFIGREGACRPTRQRPLLQENDQCATPEEGALDLLKPGGDASAERG